MTFGMLVALMSVIILCAALAVRLGFKMKLRLDTSRSMAYEDAEKTGITRALQIQTPALVILAMLATVGLSYWLVRRITTTIHGDMDAWLTWVFNAMFLLVVLQLVLALCNRRIVGDNEQRRLAVLIPLYNEDPSVVSYMLRALLHQSNLPHEVHVVDDSSTTGSYDDQREWFLRATKEAGIISTWTRTKNQGKRHAQVEAFRNMQEAEFFVTVDSDSALDYRALEEIARPFHDPKVTSVAGVILAQNNTSNLLARITDLIFVSQQLVDRSAMSSIGAVLVNSGGLAAYRRSVLTDTIDLYLSEEYLGRHVEFSDDSMLTLFALLKGKTVQQPTAFALAFMPDNFSHHYRQQVRWFRGSFIRGLW